MTGERARRPVREVAAAEVRMHHDPVNPGDPAAAVPDLERHRAGPLTLELDDEAAVVLGLALGALDLLSERLRVLGRHNGHEGLDVSMGREGGDELGVLGRGSAQAEVAAFAHGCGVAGAASPRRAERSRPDPIATPARIRTSPSAAFSVTVSSRRVTP